MNLASTAFGISLALTAVQVGLSQTTCPTGSSDAVACEKTVAKFGAQLNDKRSANLQELYKNKPLIKVFTEKLTAITEPNFEPAAVCRVAEKATAADENKLRGVLSYMGHQLSLPVRNVCTGVMRQALLQLQPDLKELAIESSKVATPSQVCGALFPTLDEPTPLQDTVQNVTLATVVQCLECSVCKFGLIWAQHDVFINPDTPAKWQAAADKFCQIETYDPEKCVSFFTKLIPRLLNWLHVHLAPDAFCDANFCLGYNADANALKCVKEVCIFVAEEQGHIDPVLDNLCCILPY